MRKCNVELHRVTVGWGGWELGGRELNAESARKEVCSLGGTVLCEKLI